MKDICLAKIRLCPNKSGVDLTTWLAPAAELFQALNMVMANVYMLKWNSNITAMTFFLLLFAIICKYLKIL